MLANFVDRIQISFVYVCKSEAKKHSQNKAAQIGNHTIIKTNNK